MKLGVSEIFYPYMDINFLVNNCSFSLQDVQVVVVLLAGVGVGFCAAENTDPHHVVETDGGHDLLETFLAHQHLPGRQLCRPTGLLRQQPAVHEDGGLCQRLHPGAPLPGGQGGGLRLPV